MQQSDGDDTTVAAAMMAALVTGSSSNESNSQGAMKEYLDKLKELVPHCPKNRNVSKLELIQHVIDYINDLQETLQNDVESPPESPVNKSLSFAEAFSHLSFGEDNNLKTLTSFPYLQAAPHHQGVTYTSDGSSDYDSRGSSPIYHSDTDCSSDEISSSRQIGLYPSTPPANIALIYTTPSPQHPFTVPNTCQNSQI